MRAFVASRVSGEDRVVLLDMLTRVQAALRDRGIEAYVSELAPKPEVHGDKLVAAFQHIDESDALVVVYRPGPASEGMSAEIGYTYGKRPIWIFAEKGAESSLFALADRLVYWSSVDDLVSKIGEMK